MKSTQVHPHELLPGFVLGVLDPNEAQRCAAHLRRCACCRAAAEAFRTEIGLTPKATPPPDPPAQIKQRLFARIAAGRSKE